MENMSLTGIDTSNRPFLLFYDISKLQNSLKICVKECPKTTLTSINDIKTYHNKGNGLCHYTFDYSELDKTNAQYLAHPYGPCPTLPVYER